MTNKISLKQVVLNSGDVVDIADGVTAVVGPNNTGKSSLLKEIRDQLSVEPYQRSSVTSKVVERLILSYEGTGTGFFEDLAKTYGLKNPGQYNYGLMTNPHVVINGNAHIELSDVEGHWGSQDGLGGRLSQFQLRYLNAEERLGLTGNVGAIDTYRDLPNSPLQILYSDRDMEARLNDLSREAFKTGAVVNRYAGGVINLHAGEVTAEEGRSPQSAEYLAEINALPLMQEQGDGMRAFVGMVMSIITNQIPLVLIDEPEAFLHPPQARMFGRFLADFAKQGSGTQVVIATHSEDVIAGLTSASRSDTHISIARLTRDRANNHVAQLSAEAVREFYEDPLMKHYDMLNGLFSTGVVLCEADSDCTYYRATVDSLPASDFGFIQEAHFTHSSGKARIAQAVKTFRETAVPVVAIFDIDILQNDGEFNKLVDVIGADRGVVDPLRNTVVGAISNRATTLKRASVKAEIIGILDKKTAEVLSAGEARKIQEAASQKSGWKDLKTAGKSLLSGGDATAFAKLCEYLEAFGVFILEQGELERIHPEITQSNKATWLREVIEGRLYETSIAAPMLQRVSDFLGSAQLRVEAAPTVPVSGE